MIVWTEKRVQRLVLLQKEGFSATVIAKKLGPAFTKGMVAGKIHRLGLTLKPVRKGSAPQRKPVPSPTASSISKAQPRKPILAPLASGPSERTPPPAQPIERIIGIPIFDLRERHCRWPLGNDRPAKFFCGAPAVPSKSWCEHHYGLAYGHRPTRQSREGGNSPAEMLLRALQTRSSKSVKPPEERLRRQRRAVG
jgi:GcrA cell cycle regulator